MTRYDTRIRLFAACLSAVAGYVDALAFIQLGGFFVSFMSGNSTRLGVGVMESAGHALLAGGLIFAFVVGVAAGSLAGRHAGKGRRKPAVLLLVSALLAAAASAAGFGAVPVAVALMALAMGAENAVFESEGEVRIGLTYMTGTLVKLGQRVADAFSGGPRFAWLPYLGLWAGLVLGAVAGAAAHPLLGLAALWPAAAAVLALALVAVRLKD